MSGRWDDGDDSCDDDIDSSAATAAPTIASRRFDALPPGDSPSPKSASWDRSPPRHRRRSVVVDLLPLPPMTISVSPSRPGTSPPNPALNADSQTSLSAVFDAVHRTCVPEYVTMRKSNDDLDDDDGAVTEEEEDDASDDNGDGERGDDDIFVVLPPPLTRRRLIDDDGGFHADAPTIRISDYDDCFR